MSTNGWQATPVPKLEATDKNSTITSNINAFSLVRRGENSGVVLKSAVEN